MRDLDQIREQDDGAGSSRLMSLALGGLATACVLFAVGVMVGREAGESRSATRDDPLTRLDQLAQQVEEAQATTVTYPERLTSVPSGAATATSATPALAPSGSLTQTTEGGPVLMAGTAPPASGVRVAAGSGTPSPAMAPTAGPMLIAPSSTPAPMGPPATAGSEGAFSVQVSSFRSQQMAQNFAARLRERGHRAFVAAPATAPNGVVWHRVRIGPFATQREAMAYRASFEARERMPTILVRREPEPLTPVSPRGATTGASTGPLQASVRAPTVH